MWETQKHLPLKSKVYLLSLRLFACFWDNNKLENISVLSDVAKNIFLFNGKPFEEENSFYKGKFIFMRNEILDYYNWNGTIK